MLCRLSTLNYTDCEFDRIGNIQIAISSFGGNNSNVSLINLFVNRKPSNDDRKCKCTKIHFIIINCDVISEKMTNLVSHNTLFFAYKYLLKVITTPQWGPMGEA